MIVAKKLTPVFLAFAVGVGVGGYGVARLMTLKKDTPQKIVKTETKKEKVPLSSESMTEATVLQAKGSVVTVALHTWINQRRLSVVCLGDLPAGDHPAPCREQAKAVGTNGNAVTTPKTGDTIFLKNIKFVEHSKVSMPDIDPMKLLVPHRDTLKVPVPAYVYKLTDGDTVGALAQPWPDQYVTINTRFPGIDTPEKKGGAKCDSEAALADKASAETKKLLAGKHVLIHDFQFEKFGNRALGRIMTLDGIDAGQNLIGKKLAVPYMGKTKQSWCPLR